MNVHFGFPELAVEDYTKKSSNSLNSNNSSRELSLSNSIDSNHAEIATFTDITWKKIIQGVSEIGALNSTGNRTRQKEQPFYLPFCRKTMFNSKKKLERFFTKIALRH
jgi:hypothetical protein